MHKTSQAKNNEEILFYKVDFPGEIALFSTEN